MGVVVDADGHVFEPAEVWVERMDTARWGDWIPRYVAEDADGNESWYIGDPGLPAGLQRLGGRLLQGRPGPPPGHGHDPDPGHRPGRRRDPPGGGGARLVGGDVAIGIAEHS